MLRDGNGVTNSIYNTSQVDGFLNANESATTNGIATGLGRESRGSGMLGPRASYGNLSSKLLDKRFNKLLINMPAIPVKSDHQIKQQKSQTQTAFQQNSSNGFPLRSFKGNRSHKSNIADENV